ncbi:MAG: hypothetical protein MPJ02_08720 [Nitrosopumilus sp.]|nr:hypothetical protein [Nitrosopumilus sp.]MDA7999614.1 hypothetical protein [Nitrosopumilus sp.]
MKPVLITALAAAALLAALQPAAAESPRAQFEAGVPLGEITCSEGRALLESPRGTPVCVLDKSVERLQQRGFVLVKPVAEPDADKTPAGDPGADDTASITDDGAYGRVADPDPVRDGSSENEYRAGSVGDAEGPRTATIRVASDAEFVDDGREYPKAMQRRPPPQPMYDLIMEGMTTEGAGMIVDESGHATFALVEHEKYSVNPGVGFYPEDWLPAYIPDGYRLLYGGSQYETYGPPGREHEEYKAYYRFVPKTFVLDKDTTNYDLLAAKGFWIEVVKTTEPLDSIGNLIEGTREFYKGSPGSYGGFKDVVRDGRSAYAFEGGDRANPYESVISWNFKDDAYISVISEYLSLDETLPIFESIMT